jgi:hypothetical protein
LGDILERLQLPVIHFVFPGQADSSSLVVPSRLKPQKDFKSWDIKDRDEIDGLGLGTVNAENVSEPDV